MSRIVSHERRGETNGISNAILEPDVFDRLRVTVLNNSYLIVDGIVQKHEGRGVG
jgi:hypothetical protein